MIGLILGTSEGKKLLRLLNEYTDDIFVSTATAYGGELLREYKYKILNCKPLELEDLVEILRENRVSVLVDASHPYAVVVSENAVRACERLNIEYVRYDRPGVIEKFQYKVTMVKDFQQLKQQLSEVEGAVLNTTGSRNIDKFLAMKLENRIVHRVLPSVEVMEKCFALGVNTEDIIAIKGPIGYELNCAFIKEYGAQAMVLKDSGTQGGTEEKLRAAIDCNIKAFVLERNTSNYNKVFNNEEELVDYIYKRYKQELILYGSKE